MMLALAAVWAQQPILSSTGPFARPLPLQDWTVSLMLGSQGPFEVVCDTGSSNSNIYADTTDMHMAIFLDRPRLICRTLGNLIGKPRLYYLESTVTVLQFIKGE